MFTVHNEEQAKKDLLASAEFLEEHGWCQHASSRWESMTEVLYCATEAITQYCKADAPNAVWFGERRRDAMSLFANHLINNGLVDKDTATAMTEEEYGYVPRQVIVVFNDQDGRTRYTVLDEMRKAAS